MKKIKWMSLALCSLMLPALSLANDAERKFKSSTKYIEPCGEFYSYTDTKGIEDLINVKLPAAVRIITADNPAHYKIADAVVTSAVKLINASAFQACAASSKEAEKGYYIAKQFILIDRTAESIFINPTASNKTLNWLELPANTRLAFKGEINLAHVWKLLKKEINQKHPLYKTAAPFLEMPILNDILKDFNGDVEILLTGTSQKNWAFKLVIPDANGKIAETLKKEFRKNLKGNKIEFPVSGNLKIDVLLKNGKIIVCSDQTLLRPAGKTLASLPHYRKFAKMLPGKGSFYLIADIPQETIDQLKNELKIPVACKMIDLFLKPFSAIAIGTVEKDGYLTTAAANFSFAQIYQTLQSTTSFLPVTAGMLLPALNSARTKARSVSCINDLKQLGTAIHMYSADHDDFLPTDLKDIVKNAYLEPKVLKNLVYVGPYGKVKISSVKNPSRYVIAVCNRKEHSGMLNVLFLDGHVEVVQAGEKSTVYALKQNYNLDQEACSRITKRLAEAEKETVIAK